MQKSFPFEWHVTMAWMLHFVVFQICTFTLWYGTCYLRINSFVIDFSFSLMVTLFFFILESPTVTLIETIDKIGVVGVAVIWKEVNSVNSQRNSSHSKWSEKDRYSIGKYTSENGVAAVVRKFKSKFPPWTEALCALFEKRLTQNWRKLQRKKES